MKRFRKYHTIIGVAVLSLFSFNQLIAQTEFNVWLTTCSHLVGPTGNPNTLKLAVNQSRGLVPTAPGFAWDVMIDLGDWTASQKPPEEEEGVLLAKCINDALGKDRGRFFTLAGNHDGDKKGCTPGDFSRKYVNPLGEIDFRESSGFSYEQRQPYKENFQLIEYPGSRWDRYLVRTGNVIWIMLSDRNEFDELANSRGDTSGLFQAGRGSACGMPDGGYPSGAVTLSTFKWWKQVVEDSIFSKNILITSHHMLLANTTIGTKAGEIWRDNPEHEKSWNKVYHGNSGSVGPNGNIGGQLYWIREYNKEGKEINQYAQTRPFLNYLRDHPGAIAAWIGGHTHIDSPESEINGRGICVRKYDVTFLSVGALTNSHARGENLMSRLLTLEDGKDEAIVNVYVHQSKSGLSIGLYEPAIRKFPLGKNFVCPDLSTNVGAPFKSEEIRTVSEAQKETLAPRYYWCLNEDHYYNFNNLTSVVGEDGSPYGYYQKINDITYSEDTPLNEGKSLDLRGTNGRIAFNAPYQPEMNWKKMTLSLWLKTSSIEPQEVISYSSNDDVGKFRLWYDGTDWIWDVAEGTVWRSARWKSATTNNGQNWHHFVAIADGEKNLIQLWVDAKLMAEEKWSGKYLNPAKKHQFVIGASGDTMDTTNLRTWSRPFNGLIDEIKVFDSVILSNMK